MTREEIIGVLNHMCDREWVYDGFAGAGLDPDLVAGCTTAYMDTLNGIMEYVRNHDDDHCLKLVAWVHKMIDSFQTVSQMICTPKLGWSTFAVYSCYATLLDLLDLY